MIIKGRVPLFKICFSGRYSGLVFNCADRSALRDLTFDNTGLLSHPADYPVLLAYAPLGLGVQPICCFNRLKNV